MEQKIEQLKSKLETDENFGEKLFSFETQEEVRGFLSENGMDFSIEEIGALKEGIVKALEKQEGEELSDDDLDDVAGGFLIMGAWTAATWGGSALAAIGIGEKISGRRW